MKHLIILALLSCASAWGQVQTIPDTTFPIVRSLINANFLWLNFNKEPSLGNPNLTGSCLTSTTGGVRGWVACGSVASVFGRTGKGVV
jgi:hypothetical protein